MFDFYATTLDIAFKEGLVKKVKLVLKVMEIGKNQALNHQNRKCNLFLNLQYQKYVLYFRVFVVSIRKLEDLTIEYVLAFNFIIF